MRHARLAGYRMSVDLALRHGVAEEAQVRDEDHVGERDGRAGGGVVEGEERRRDAEDRDEPSPPAGELPRPRLALELLDELLGLGVGRDLFESRKLLPDHPLLAHRTSVCA
ncbi:MAG: hypothetical protein AUH85_00610 [Chloroflexi bacterium 13_1_40CM_4_68_4]|nr:MAG: hypothetical protein AUH85_00610 [Chloroflexi bacterium 13_1_40CM_4_68_4]